MSTGLLTPAPTETAAPPRPTPPTLRDFLHVLAMLRWHDLDEVLPARDGWCLDVGCGNGRHRPLIEQRGYRWLGMDRAPATTAPEVVRADCCHLPVQSESVSAMILWQVLEYVERPENVFAEASRVLEPGGVFCGSVSFLEPIHGHTFYGLSPLLLERLLQQHGFEAIQVRAGLCGFVLLLWTWLRRLMGPWAGCLAVPMVALWFVPLAGARFLLSYVVWRLGVGGGHGMNWLARCAPLEFAGHVLFVARKSAWEQQCTSDF